MDVPSESRNVDPAFAKAAPAQASAARAAASRIRSVRHAKAMAAWVAQLELNAYGAVVRVHGPASRAPGALPT